MLDQMFENWLIEHPWIPVLPFGINVEKLLQSILRIVRNKKCHVGMGAVDKQVHLGLNASQPW